MPKPRAGAAGALHDVATIAVGGFGLRGNPTDLIEALRDSTGAPLAVELHPEVARRAEDAT